MAKQEYEFTLILSGVQELTREVLDALYEAGCDDALIGMRDGVAYVEFCREADSFREAILSAIHNVESAGVGARVEHIEPDEFVTMSEIARRLDITREGVRKRVSGERGPGNFPSPVGSLTKRSPLWRWTDVLQWQRTNCTKMAKTPEAALPPAEAIMPANLGRQIAVLNAALGLRKHAPLEEAVQILQYLVARGEKRKSGKKQLLEKLKESHLSPEGNTMSTDVFGSQLGSNSAKANAVLSATIPKTMDQMASEGRFQGATVYDHLSKMEEAGYVQIDKTVTPQTYLLVKIP